MLIGTIHSSADIITNSSSELFICNTSKTLGEIQSMLEILSCVVGYPNCGVGEIKVYNGVDDFKKVVDSLDTCYLDHTFYRLVNNAVGYDNIKDNNITIPQVAHDWNTIYTDGPDDETFEERMERWDRERDKQREPIEKFFADNYDFLKEHIGIFYTIESESDNTIPYELFELFERQLNAIRFHLG